VDPLAILELSKNTFLLLPIHVDCLVTQLIGCRLTNGGRVTRATC